jgi:ectoine hydroxylase
MQLTQDQMDQYNRDGVVSLGKLISDAELALLREELAADMAVAGPHRIVDNDGDRVRAIYASHERCPSFRQLVASIRSRST